jgi:hypothetical protein
MVSRRARRELCEAFWTDCGASVLLHSPEWAVSDGDGKEYRYPKEKSVKNFSSFGKKMFDKGLFFC